MNKKKGLSQGEGSVRKMLNNLLNHPYITIAGLILAICILSLVLANFIQFPNTLPTDAEAGEAVSSYWVNFGALVGIGCGAVFALAVICMVAFIIMV